MPDAVEKYGFGTSPFQTNEGVTFGRAESGFDTLTISYYGSTTDPKVYADLHFPTGSLLSGYGNMYVSNVDCQQEGQSVWRFTVHAKGLLTLQAVKRTITTRSQSYNTGAVTLPVGGAVPQAQGQYINLACTFQYVSFYLPTLNVEPQDAAVPAGATLPSPPSNPWGTVGSITSPIYNYPNGWLRQGLNIDQVTGAEVYMITEEWEYVYEYMPG
jgi:hypothetical protein